MHSFSTSKWKAQVSWKSWRVWLSVCPKATLYFFSYCIGFNVAFQINKHLDVLFLLLVSYVKLLRLLKTTMWWLRPWCADLKKTCKSGKLSIRSHLQSFPRVFVVFPSSGPITIIGFCLCWFSPRSRKKVGSVFILHARCPRAHVRHVIKEASSTTNNGMSFLKVLTLISLFSLQSVTVFNIGVPFSLGFSTAL